MEYIHTGNRRVSDPHWFQHGSGSGSWIRLCHHAKAEIFYLKLLLQETGFKPDLKRYKSWFELWRKIMFIFVSLLLDLGPDPWGQNEQRPIESYIWSSFKVTLPTIFNAFDPVLWIRDILVRIRICGSVPLTYGSGSRSCFFRQCLKTSQLNDKFSCENYEDLSFLQKVKSIRKTHARDVMFTYPKKKILILREDSDRLLFMLEFKM